MEGNKISFIIRATYDVLPSPKNLHQWYGEDPMCALRQTPAALKHIMTGCKTGLTQGRYTWRNNQVLKSLASALESKRTTTNSLPPRPSNLLKAIMTLCRESWSNPQHLVQHYHSGEEAGLKAGSLHFPGTAATYKEETVRVRQVEPRFYDHSNETEWRLNIDKVIGEWFHQQDLEFVSLYFGEPDLAGHEFGPDSPECRAMVQQVDRTVGYIRDKIQDHGLTDRLNIIITADHGMTRILRDGLVEEIILS
ncbi:hypothetical protein ABVT39_021687 [Epinephelus coioides]